ncbi:MAG: glycosyltransferase [Desulfocurvibacter africanus]
MNAEIKFSMVIPARNAERTLGACLGSLRAVDYPQGAYEIVVVDDGSTDRTAEIAQSMGAEVVTGTFRCIPEIRNAGARAARGEILVHMDSDMVVEKGFLRRAHEYYFEQGYTGCLSFVDKAPEDSNWLARLWHTPLRTRLHVPKHKDYLTTRNLFVPRAIIDAVGGLDEALFLGRKGGSDKEYTYRIHRAGFPLVSDPSQTLINLGYEKSLAEFLKKEWWHQGNMLFIAKRHGFPLRILRNPLLGLYHVLGLGGSLAALFLMPVPWALAPLTIWAFPSLAIVMRQASLGGQWSKLPPLWLVTFLRWNAAGISVPFQLANLWRKPCSHGLA